MEIKTKQQGIKVVADVLDIVGGKWRGKILSYLCTVMNLDDNEINGFYQPIVGQNGKLIIFETSEGGTGTLSSIVRDADLLKRIAVKALDILHFDEQGNDKDDACATSCYYLYVLSLVL
jgi:hypothetical protein